MNQEELIELLQEVRRRDARWIWHRFQGFLDARDSQPLGVFGAVMAAQTWKNWHGGPDLKLLSKFKIHIELNGNP
jgi:hypothetical protein